MRIFWPGNGKGWALKIETFLGPYMATHENKITNGLVFYLTLGPNGYDRGKFITRAIGKDFPASKALRPAPYKQQVH